MISGRFAMNSPQASTTQAKEPVTCDVAILYCDLRGIADFWPLASEIEVILFINRYFTDIRAIIDAHHGVINQFFDDTVLAIFGLEASVYPVAQAMQAGLAIIAHSAELDVTNAVPSAISIGIDFSSVQVSTLLGTDGTGYQYLIIGDNADNAKSLQALCNHLGHHITLSSEAYGQLPDRLCQHLISLGEHKLSDGKNPVALYGEIE